jgi:hypothetical protein
MIPTQRTRAKIPRLTNPVTNLINQVTKLTNPAMIPSLKIDKPVVAR